MGSNSNPPTLTGGDGGRVIPQVTGATRLITEWLRGAVGTRAIYEHALARVPDAVVGDLAAGVRPAISLHMALGDWLTRGTTAMLKYGASDLAAIDDLIAGLSGLVKTGGRGRVFGAALTCWLESAGPMGIAQQTGLVAMPATPAPKMPSTGLPAAADWFPHAAAVLWMRGVVLGTPQPVSLVEKIIGSADAYQRDRTGGGITPMAGIDALDALVDAGLATRQGDDWAATPAADLSLAVRK